MPESTPKLNRRDTRQLAMQLMYQFDVRGKDDPAEVRASVPDEVGSAELIDAACALAERAWALHDQADAAITPLTPDWPTHRQAPVDRATLRLAYAEMRLGHAPHRVVLNEAVELAKKFSAEQSPAFINAVLDKLSKQIPQDPNVPPELDQPKAREDPWLADAIKHTVEDK